ncbi:High affinity cAMP-specific 3',5'-cyclic phosphodiesterase 7A [Blyttiomyces sp. JEL0837]|nr:High affinity cAMP-specific 3',5'-cyclic phosphodiesterase 7A [Blyttiomyces sp. JEL0837]
MSRPSSILGHSASIREETHEDHHEDEIDHDVPPLSNASSPAFSSGKRLKGKRPASYGGKPSTTTALQTEHQSPSPGSGGGGDTQSQNPLQIFLQRVGSGTFRTSSSNLVDSPTAMSPRNSAFNINQTKTTALSPPTSAKGSPKGSPKPVRPRSAIMRLQHQGSSSNLLGPKFLSSPTTRSSSSIAKVGNSTSVETQNEEIKAPSELSSSSSSLMAKSTGDIEVTDGNGWNKPDEEAVESEVSPVRKGSSNRNSLEVKRSLPNLMIDTSQLDDDFTPRNRPLSSLHPNRHAVTSEYMAFAMAAANTVLQSPRVEKSPDQMSDESSSMLNVNAGVELQRRFSRSDAVALSLVEAARTAVTVSSTGSAIALKTASLQADTANYYASGGGGSGPSSPSKSNPAVASSPSSEASFPTKKSGPGLVSEASVKKPGLGLASEAAPRKPGLGVLTDVAFTGQLVQATLSEMPIKSNSVEYPTSAQQVASDVIYSQSTVGSPGPRRLAETIEENSEEHIDAASKLPSQMSFAKKRAKSTDFPTAAPASPTGSRHSPSDHRLHQSVVASGAIPSSPEQRRAGSPVPPIPAIPQEAARLKKIVMMDINKMGTSTSPTPTSPTYIGEPSRRESQASSGRGSFTETEKRRTRKPSDNNLRVSKSSILYRSNSLASHRNSFEVREGKQEQQSPNTMMRASSAPFVPQDPDALSIDTANGTNDSPKRKRRGTGMGPVNRSHSGSLVSFSDSPQIMNSPEGMRPRNSSHGASLSVGQHSSLHRNVSWKDATSAEKYRDTQPQPPPPGGEKPSPPPEQSKPPTLPERVASLFGFGNAQSNLDSYMPGDTNLSPTSGNSVLKGTTHPFTLTFNDPELEEGYQQYFAHYYIPIWRYGAVLEVVICLAIGIYHFVKYPGDSDNFKSLANLRSTLYPTVNDWTSIPCTPGLVCLRCFTGHLCNEFFPQREILILILGILLPCTLIYLISFKLGPTSPLKVYSHVIATIHTSVVIAFPITLRHYIVEPSISPFKTALLQLLSLFGCIIMFRIRFCYSMLLLPISIISFVSESYITLQDQESDDYSGLVIGLICLIGGISISCVGAYDFERNARAQYFRSHAYLTTNAKLVDQLKDMSKNYSDRVADFNSPLEKAIGMITMIRMDPKLSVDHFDSMGMILALLNSSDLMTPDIDRQVEGGMVELDEEGEAWLFSNLYRARVRRGSKGNSGRRRSTFAENPMPSTVESRSVSATNLPMSSHLERIRSGSQNFLSSTPEASGSQSLFRRRLSSVSALFSHPAPLTKGGTSSNTSSLSNRGRNLIDDGSQSRRMSLAAGRRESTFSNRSGAMRQNYARKQSLVPDGGFGNDGIASAAATAVTTYSSSPQYQTQGPSITVQRDSAESSPYPPRNGGLGSIAGGTSVNSATAESGDSQRKKSDDSSKSDQDRKNSLSNNAEWDSLTNLNVHLQMVSLLEKVDLWNWEIFDMDTVTSQRPLFTLAHYLFLRADLYTSFQIPLDVFLNFLTKIESGYHKDVPYHNAIHATDVLHGVNFLLTASEMFVEPTSLELLSLYIAAIIHDFDPVETTISSSTPATPKPYYTMTAPSSKTTI